MTDLIKKYVTNDVNSTKRALNSFYGELLCKKKKGLATDTSIDGFIPGPMEKYQIMTKDALKTLKKFGNTVMGYEQFRNSIKRIWHDTISKRFPKGDVRVNPLYKEDFEKCQKTLEESISKIIGFEVHARFAGPWGPVYDLKRAHDKHGRTLSNFNHSDFKIDPTRTVYDHSIAIGCWIIERKGLNYDPHDFRS